MRSAGKLAVIATMAFTALALTASSASAVELVNEDAGPDAHCTPVEFAAHTAGAGGCQIGATSEGQVELGSPLGMIWCENTFEARADEAGAGYIYDQALGNCTPTDVVPCEEAAGTDNWPVQLTSSTRLEARFCVDIPPFFEDVHCHLPNVHVNQINHDLVEFATEGHQTCEETGYSVEGHWVATDVGENHPEIEIRP